jgi:ubiquitin C-terminal hydrolase
MVYFIVSEDASKFMTILNNTVLEEIQCRTLFTALNTFFMKFYWMEEHKRRCGSCNGISTNMEGGCIFPLQFTPEHFTRQKDCTLNELFQVYQDEYVLQEYACEKCSVQSTVVQTDRITTLPTILCAVVGQNIIHNGLATMIMSPVDYPVERLNDVDVTFDEYVNNTDHGYTPFGIINYRSTGPDTGHYTAICKSKETDDWFGYNDEHVQKSHLRKKMEGPRSCLISGWFLFSFTKNQNPRN